MRNPLLSRTLHRWCWGLSAVLALLATQGVGAVPLAWIALGLLLVGDVLWVRAARPVADPRPMPSSGYILMTLVALLWVPCAYFWLLMLVWGDAVAGPPASVALVAAIAAAHHPMAWLAGHLLGQVPRLRLVRAVVLVGMVLVVPGVVLGHLYLAGGFGLPAELLVVLPWLCVVGVLGLGDLLSRHGSR